MSRLAELLARRAATAATPATNGEQKGAECAESSESSGCSRGTSALAEYRRLGADHSAEAREERAAIMEYDAGLPRPTAERLAGMQPRCGEAAHDGSAS
jgi:hypothetical protein